MITWQDVLKKAEEFGWKPVGSIEAIKDYSMVSSAIQSPEHFEALIRMQIFSPEFLLAWARFVKDKFPDREMDITFKASELDDEQNAAEIGYQVIMHSIWSNKPYLDYFAQFLREE